MPSAPSLVTGKACCHSTNGVNDVRLALVHGFASRRDFNFHHVNKRNWYLSTEMKAREHALELVDSFFPDKADGMRSSRDDFAWNRLGTLTHTRGVVDHQPAHSSLAYAYALPLGLLVGRDNGNQARFISTADTSTNQVSPSSTLFLLLSLLILAVPELVVSTCSLRG